MTNEMIKILAVFFFFFFLILLLFTLDVILRKHSELKFFTVKLTLEGIQLYNSDLVIELP